MQQPVARHHLAYLQVEFVPRIVGGLAPRFPQYHHARRDIPSLDAAFVVPVEPPCRDVTQVELSGAEPPHALRTYRELPEEFDGGRHLVGTVRETAGQEPPTRPGGVSHTSTVPPQ